MIAQMVSQMGQFAWLATGLALGAAGMALGRRVIAWREARIASEWDPY
jgi:hypothetical protein